MGEKNSKTDVKTNALPDWAEILAAVCKRPRMYTSPQKFENVLDFIGGYLLAQEFLSPKPRNPSHPEQEQEWLQFSYWLAKKFGYPRNFAWHYARKYFATDEEAIEALPVLLEEFRKEKEKP